MLVQPEGSDPGDPDDRTDRGPYGEGPRSGGADRGHDSAYADGVQDAVAAIVEMLRELNASLGEPSDESESDLLPLGRATRRFAADLRLMVAHLSRLRGPQGATGLPVEQVHDLTDAIGLLIVAAHALERIGGLGPPLDHGQRAVTRTGVGDVGSVGTLLAAFVVGVTMHGSPTSEDAEELVRLADQDVRTLAAARERILQIDELAGPVRDHALELLEQAVRRLA